jgi:hypothetical protein
VAVAASLAIVDIGCDTSSETEDLPVAASLGLFQGMLILFGRSATTVSESAAT